MSFPHNFEAGDVLQASDMNEIEVEIQNKVAIQTDTSLFNAVSANAGIYTYSLVSGVVVQGARPLANVVSAGFDMPVTSQAVAASISSLSNDVVHSVLNTPLTNPVVYVAAYTSEGNRNTTYRIIPSLTTDNTCLPNATAIYNAVEGRVKKVSALPSSASVLYGATNNSSNNQTTDTNFYITASITSNNGIPTSKAVYDALQTKADVITSLSSNSAILYGATSDSSGQVTQTTFEVKSSISSGIEIGNFIPNVTAINVALLNKLDKANSALFQDGDKFIYGGERLDSLIIQTAYYKLTDDLSDDIATIPSNKAVSDKFKSLFSSPFISYDANGQEITAVENCYIDYCTYDSSKRLLIMEGWCTMAPNLANNFGSVDSFGIILRNQSDKSKYRILGFPSAGYNTYSGAPIYPHILERDFALDTVTGQPGWRIHIAAYIINVPNGTYDIGFCPSNLDAVNNILRKSNQTNTKRTWYKLSTDSDPTSPSARHDTDMIGILTIEN